LKALFYLATSQFLIASNLVSIKYALQFISPEVYTSLRYLFAFVFSLSLCFFTRPSFHQQDKKYLPILALQAISGGILFNLCMTFGLQYTDASMAGIITSLLPMVTILLSWIVFQAKISANNFMAIAICVFGLILVSGANPHAHHRFLGDFFVFLALIPEATYYILTQRFPSPIHFSLNACLAFLLNALLFLLLFHQQLMHLENISMGLWLLIGTQGLSLSMNYYFWLKGCEHASETTVALSTALMPLTTLCLAVLLLHEHLTAIQAVGSFLILTTLFIHRRHI